MRAEWLPLPLVLSSGEDLILTDQSIWLDPLREFKMDCRVILPLEARLQFLPQAEGLLVRGQIGGQVILPCKLCAEDAQVDLRRGFDSFEPFPSSEADQNEADLDVDTYFIRWSPALAPRRPGKSSGKKSVRENAREAFPSGPGAWNGLEINPGNLVWEEFVQSLPSFPLCREDCAGLCPHCGHNLNQGACGCEREDADPRLEPLRGLKLSK